MDTDMDPRGDAVMSFVKFLTYAAPQCPKSTFLQALASLTYLCKQYCYANSENFFLILNVI